MIYFRLRLTHQEKWERYLHNKQVGAIFMKLLLKDIAVHSATRSSVLI